MSRVIGTEFVKTYKFLQVLITTIIAIAITAVMVATMIIIAIATPITETGAAEFRFRFLSK